MFAKNSELLSPKSPPIDLKKFWRLKIRAVQETSSDKVKPNKNKVINNKLLPTKLNGISV